MNPSPPIDLRQMRRVLIIRLSSIGDVVHALPVSAALGETFPHLEITWMVEEMSAQMVEGNPYLHDVIVIPRSRWKKGRRSPRIWREQAAFYRELRARKFDLTLDLQGYAKSGVLAAAAGAPHRYGYHDLREMSRTVSKPLPHVPAKEHRIEWYLEAAEGLGARIETVRFPLEIPGSARDHVRDLLCRQGISPGQRYAVLNPAAGDVLKHWGPDDFAELARALPARFGLTPVLVGSARDEPLCRSIAEAAEAAEAQTRKEMRTAECPESSNDKGWARPVVLAGQVDLKQLAALLDGAAVHVAGDTGSLHIAAALGRPLVALFGPTDPQRTGPWGQMDHVLSHREMCAGCSMRGCLFPPDRPGQAAARCMRSIAPGQVLSLIEQISGAEAYSAVS